MHQSVSLSLTQSTRRSCYRRTFKDIITFIPFVIILLIPLTPIGHVLVFGAIQRFFPDFFPSCFTEQRQNLLQLYETAEYSELTIKETWGVSTSMVFSCHFSYTLLHSVRWQQKKLSRLFTATIYLIANSMRKAYFRLSSTQKPGRREDDESQ